jgi:Zn-dependent protease with chaperone function
MKQRAWLVQRAALAVLLMVSFYALALGVAGGLLWIPYEAYSNDVRLPLKLALLCVAGAGTIVWAILPRPDRFVAPGPRLTRADAPPLFAALEDVAKRTEQAMPADVYLVNDVNAFVAQRGGLMGIGSKRVMGVGLPLLQSLTVQEFRAVLAHEFGHYHAGDVKIGPWIYKTRAAIGRTIEKLSGNVLQKIFVAYGNLFLRVTHAVSRRQEFIADEVAGNAAGAAVMASALRKVHGAAAAFHDYWRGEVAPVLNSGFLPPISAGFAKFVQADLVASNMAAAVKTAEAEHLHSPFDTHPPLRERVAALQVLPQGLWGDTRPAVMLLGDPQRWERRLLGASINEDWARSLTPLAWEGVVEKVYLPLWRQAVKENARQLAGTLVSRPAFAGKLADAMARGRFHDADQAIVNRVQLTITALSLALYTNGWQPHTAPGEAIVFRRGEQKFDPAVELMAVATGKVGFDAWVARCVELGIDGLVLGGTGAEA